ncbi:MAG: hypothetical protein KHY83_07895, partial [Coriobacteriia bacterium]|nr:hypothetical protein [Coriobacteriia bacterium]
VKGTEVGMTYDEAIYTVEVKVTSKVSGDKTVLNVSHVIKDASGKILKNADGTNLQQPTFANTYKADGAEATLKAHKTLSGRDLKAGEFTFDLYEGMQFGSPDASKFLQSKTNDADGNVTFDSLAYEKTGEYWYTLAERVPEDAVNNTYQGITYQNELEFVCVTVALDKATGKLVASVKGVNSNSDTVQFANSYNAAGNVLLTAKKAYNGGAMPAGDDAFQFQLFAGDKAEGTPLQTKTVGADGVVSFDRIAYTLSQLTGKDDKGNATKTFTYSVKEVVPEDAAQNEDGTYTKNGVTYSNEVAVYTVKVTDNGKGGLTRVVTAKVGVKDMTSTDSNGYAQPVLTNKYEAKPVTDTLTATKSVTSDGDAYELEAGQFSFTLKNTTAPTGQSFADQTKSNDAQGAIAFDELTFGAEGTYVFELSENDVDPEKAPGVSKDGVIYTITYEVKDDGKGNLSVESKTVTPSQADGAHQEQTGTDATPTFVNAYKPGEATYALGGTKVIDNAAGDTSLQAGERSFSFTLTAGENTAGVETPMPEGAENGSKTVSNNGATFTFGEMTYTKEGTYHYTVTEVAGADPDITYSTVTYDVAVTVTDVKGQLTPSATYTIGDEAADAISFTNVYKPTSVTATLNVYKTLDGRDLSADEFTFDLYEGELSADDIAASGTHKPLATAKNDGDGNAAFTTPELSKVGSYDYTIVEERAGSTEAGVTYDPSVHHVRVTVGETEDHKLEVTSVSYNGGTELPVTFTNTYKASGSLTLAGTKAIAGRPWQEGDKFTFQVTNAKGDASTVVATGTASAAAGTDAVSISFSEINYTLAGVKADAENGLAIANEDGSYTYTYTVSESAEGLPRGVTPAAPKTVTVTISDNGDGTLTVTPNYGDNATSVGFTNTYTNEGTASVSLNGAKSLTSNVGSTTIADLAGKFSFTLSGSDGAPMPEGSENGAKTVANDEQGAVDFGSITYKKADLGDAMSKTFTYTVTENGSTDGKDGITNDPKASRTIKVTVSDDGKGGLTAQTDPEVTGDMQLFSFANTYKATPASAVLGATKTLSGRDLAQGEFTFDLYEGELTAEQIASGEHEPIASASNDASGAVSFPAQAYEAEGEHDYTIVERKGNLGGVTYDDAVHHAHVSVADNHAGALEATVSYDDGSTQAPAFANTYAASGSLTLAGTKAIAGRPWQEGDEFTFVVTNANDKSDPKAVVSTGTVKADSGTDAQAFSFGEITYDLAGLQAAVEAGLATRVATADKPTWTLQYDVTEQADGLPSNVTAALAQCITVTVIDNGDGTLGVSATQGDKAIGTATAPLAFTNTYTNNGTALVSLSGTKVLEADDGTSTSLADLAGKFSFTLSGLDGAPMPDGSENGTKTVVSSRDGSIDFGTITYDKADLGDEMSRTFAYAVHEVVPDDAVNAGGVTYAEADNTVRANGGFAKDGVTYDGAEKTVKVTVSDDGQGGLTVATDPKATAGMPLFSFTNGYKATPTDAELGATKTLSGRDLRDGEFTFALYKGNLTADQIATGEVEPIAMATNGATGSVSFGALSFDKVGEYEYTIVEQAGELGGVSYDSSVHHAQVVVTDNHDGTLSAAVSYDGAASTPDQSNLPVFANGYAARGSLELGGTKEIDNGDHGTTLSPVTGAFSFELAALSGTLADGTELVPADVPMPEGSTTVDGTPAKVVSNNGAAFSFGEITYKAAGTYAYRVTEQVPVTGADETIAYSTLTYTVSVGVVDNGDGTLTATPTYAVQAAPDFEVETADGISFTNAYTPKAVEAQLSARKALEGRDLVAGEFAFDLYEGTLSAGQIASGEAAPLASASNGATGSVSFDALSFDKVGTYEYTIAERPGELGGVSYDGSVHHATVTVSESDAHELVASVSYDGAGDVPPTFANAYDASGSLELLGSKAVEGQGWTAGATYDFVIVNAADKAAKPVSTGSVTPSGEAGGNPAGFAFAPIEYTLDGLEAAAEAGLAEAGTNDAGQRTWTLH